MVTAKGSAETWPRLDLPGCLDTSTTMQLWSQIVGKTRLALCAPSNHWWHVPLYVSARGLTTSPIPVGARVFDVEFDLIAHQLLLRVSDGGLASIKLGDGSLASFYEEYVGRLAGLGIGVNLFTESVETPERVHLASDSRPRHYDPAWANAFFRALVQIDAVMKIFRGRFMGKASPVHFFWGGFDLAVTRFSGRAAPPHPGGIPNIGDWVMREAYSREVSSAGFWPGDARFPEAAFYSYAYPDPPGFKDAKVQPAAAHFDPALGEFILPYSAVRTARDPAADILAFLESTYAAAANLAKWDRATLERPEAK